MQLILQANHIKKQYGVRTILDFESLQVYEGNKIGIVGLNGAGKTTLLGILSGELDPDEGSVSRKREVAYIRQFEEHDGTLSGGETVKKRITRETARRDTIIFADEPTANLDQDGVRWVQSKLEAAGTVLLISHDRHLLDAVCDRIIEVKDGKLYFYTGNYSDYVEQAELQKDQQLQQFEEFKKKKEQLTSAIQTKDKRVSHQKSKRKNALKKNSSEARLGGHKWAASVKHAEKEAKVLKARLDRLEAVERPRELPKFRINFEKTDPPVSKIIVSSDSFSFAYGDNAIFDKATFAIPNGKKVAITGKNGAGKTTLFRQIQAGDPQIRIAPKLQFGYLHQGLENIDPTKTVLENAMRDSVQERADVYSVLAGLLFTGGDFEKKAAALSGGERIRLSLGMLIVSGCNALMLDEPTNYLDIRSIEAVQRMVKEYPGAVLLVSHDAAFRKAVTDMELLVEGGKVHAIQQETKPAKPSEADRMILELRRTKLASSISSAPSEEKARLEAEYQTVLEELRRFG
ncbi:ATP-binding cassette domain-containing protein [Ruminococcaceae bacterium OttesenSCG-928-L11]|nr:ATP-binding cassette domain-containing protein [Ruminococcaceae bacterium OttesenSCG-928-L11]